MKEVAIIGAGPSGLAAAYALARVGVRPVVFEKSRGVSGRAATRRRGPDLCFDHGANFFRTEDEDVRQLVHEELPTGELVEIPREVWTFDRDGVIEPGDPEQNAQPKYTYRRGISTLGKLLAEATDLDLRRSCRVAQLIRAKSQWTIVDSRGVTNGPFDFVLLTPPAPQAAALLEASEMNQALRDTLGAALRAARYHSQFSFVLGWNRRLLAEREFHALVNVDRGHEVAWLSFEDDKPGHVPAEQSVMVVQMSPTWSASRLDEAPSELLPEVLATMRALLPDIARDPAWWDSQRWLLAHPEDAADSKMLRTGEAAGLFFAGDGLAGKGRVPLALKSGLEAGRRIAEICAG